MRRLITTLAATVAATVAVGLVATPGHARTEVSREQVPYAFFYDNIVTAEGEPASTLILFAGASPQQQCTGDVPMADLRVRVKGTPPESGAIIRESFVERGGLWLYEGGGLQAPDFLGQYCEAYFSGGDVPQALGVGEGTVRAGVSVDFVGPDAPESAQQTNVAVGLVRTDEGRSLFVRGSAALTLAPEFSVDEVELLVRPTP